MSPVLTIVNIFVSRWLKFHLILISCSFFISSSSSMNRRKLICPITSGRKITFPIPRDWKSYFPPAHSFLSSGRKSISNRISIALSVIFFFRFKIRNLSSWTQNYLCTFRLVIIWRQWIWLGIFLFLLFSSCIPMSRMSKKSRQTLGKEKNPSPKSLSPAGNQPIVHK